MIPTERASRQTFGSLKGAAFGNEIDCERTQLHPSHLRDKLRRKRETIRVNVNPHGHLFLSFIICENHCQKEQVCNVTAHAYFSCIERELLLHQNEALRLLMSLVTQAENELK